MEFFPLFANLRGQPCLLVGGGEVAARKARPLVAAGARLTVNAPECCPALLEMLRTTVVRLHRGPFEPALVRDHLLVIAATSDPAVNHLVAEAARAELRLCNVVDDGPASTFIVPAVVDRSPIVVAVSSGGRAPALARLLRQRLEHGLPARLGDVAAWAGRLRGRVKQRSPDPRSRRAFWEWLFTGPATERVLQGDEAGAKALAAARLDGGLTQATTGRAWLVGAGPGDPGLISIRGLRILELADVVLHDRLVSPQLLRVARRDAEIVCVGKTGGGAATEQEDINRLLVSRVRAGLGVCRLKGGDPLIFGRGGEEALALAAAGLPFEIVPGITAASACAAVAGIPLTHRGVAAAVTLVTARTAGGDDPDWARLAVPGQTLVVYMSGRRVPEVAAELKRHGRPAATPATLVVDGTGARQRIVTGTLADIAGRSEGCRGLWPALLIVGETAALAATLAGRIEENHAGAGEGAAAWPALPAAILG